MGMFKKSGGGILHNKTGVISGLTFETKEWDGKKGKDSYHTLNAVLTVREDGQEEDTTSYLNAGFIHPDQGEEVVDGEPKLISDNDEGFINENTDFARFIASIIEVNPDLQETLEEGNGLDFSMLVGLRAKFARKVDAEANAKFGKRKVTKGPHKGKEFNRDYVIVTEVLGREAAKGGKKTAAKTTSKKQAAAEVEEDDADGDDAEATAKTVLLAILKANKGKVQKANLNSLVMKYATENDMESEERDAIRKIVASEKFLKSEDGWEFDGKLVTK